MDSRDDDPVLVVEQEPVAGEHRRWSFYDASDGQFEQVEEERDVDGWRIVGSDLLKNLEFDTSPGR